MRHIQPIAMIALLCLAPCSGQGTISVFAGTGNPPITAGAIGDGGQAKNAFLDGPESVTTDAAGNLYIRERARVRKINTSGVITTYAGTGTTGFSGDGGPAASARLGAGVQKAGLATDAAGNLYIADTNNQRIRKVDPAGTITTIAGNGQTGIAPTGDGNAATSVPLCFPTGISVDRSSNSLYIGSSVCTGVRKVDLATGVITTVARNSVGASYQTAVDGSGNLYLHKGGGPSRIDKVSAAGTITTVAGNGTAGFSGDGGPATSAQLMEVDGVTLDSAGSVFIADSGNGRIRKVDLNGTIETVAGGPGSGCPDLFFSGCPATNLNFTPDDVVFDAAGNLYTAGFVKGLIYKITGLASGAPVGSQPTITSVVSAASLQAGVGANAWVTIFGSNLSLVTDNWNNSVVNGALPTRVGGVSVSIGGKAAYVYFISPNQINVLAPDVPSGSVAVTVTNSAGTSAPFVANSNVYAPALFAWPDNQPVATRQDYSFAVKPGTFAGVATVAAKPGDVLILWATGMGTTIPAAPVGVATPLGTFETPLTPTVTINGVSATVFGKAALSPGAAGLFQIAIQVPASLADGDWPIRLTIGGVQSAAGVLLSVRR